MNEISKTLYAKYILEREDAQIIESPYAFIIYKIASGSILILNTYVDDGHRKSGRFKEVFKRLIQIAKDKSISVILGEIQMNDLRRDETLSVALHLGFKTIKPKEESIVIGYFLGDKNG